MELDPVGSPPSKNGEQQVKDVLYIPSLHSDLTVVLPWTDMKDAELVVDLFKAEEAPLSFWIDAARIYYNKGMNEQYMIMLKELTSDDVGEHYGEAGKVQRVQAFCALAEAKLEDRLRAKTQEERGAAILAAQTYLTGASTIDPSNEVTEQWVAIGQVELAEGRYGAAKRAFDEAVSKAHGGLLNCGGRLGSAYCCFRQGKFTEALEHYGEVMTSLGSDGCPNYVRLAMAACYLQQKRHDMAERCYRRVAELDASSAEAKAGLGALGVLSLKPEEVESGLKMLMEAFELNPHLPFVLSSACEQLYNRGDYASVARLSRAVLDSKPLEPSIKAEAYYYLGMVCHLRDQQEQALALFRNARNEDPEYSFPARGMARVHIRRGEVSAAVEALESIEEANNADLEVLVGLSVLYKALGESQKAVQFAQRALAIDKGNILLEEYLANLLAGLDSKKALGHFDRVMRRKEGDGKGAERVLMVNNAAVMHYQCGEHGKALGIFQKALKLAENTVYSFPIRYNIARCHEALGSLQRASQQYKQLLGDVPGYLECTLRLAAVCFSMGYDEQAIKYCKDALKKYENNPECLAMLVWIYLTKGKAREAHIHIREMDKHCKGQADFVQTALGGMYLLSGFKESRRGHKEAGEKHLNSALTMFKQAVQHSPRNMFAAHGLGVCFALQERNHVAKKIFDKILDAGKQDIKIVDMPEAWQNKASINLENGHYQDAWRAYMYCQQTFYGKQNVAISHLMAQALNAAGNKGAATKLLQRTIHLEPDSLPSKYCLAVVLMGHAHQIIHTPASLINNKERIKDLEYAKSRLILAKFHVDHLFKLKDAENQHVGPHVELDINRSSLKKLQKSAVLMQNKVDGLLRDALDFERQKTTQEENFAEIVEIDRLEKRAKETREREEREAKERQREEIARKNAEKLARMQEEWAKGARKRPPAGKTVGRGGKEAAGAGDEDEEMEDQAASVWSTDLLAATEEEQGGEDEGEDEGEEKKVEDFKPPSKRKKTALLEESDSE